MKNIIKIIINSFFKLFKVQNNKILFECGRGMIDGSPKAIYDYIKENYPNKYKLVWIINKNIDSISLEKKDYCYVKSIRSYYERSTAKYWIKSESIGSIIKKRNNQIYIQAWHGHGALKKMGYDVIKEKASEPLDHVKEWDYLLTNDPVDEKMMRTSTLYRKDCVMIGTPLTDYVLKNSTNPEFKKEILNKLGIKNKKPIIFYAPTFRDEDLTKEVIDLKIDSLKKLVNYNIIIRLHPLIKDKVPKEIWKNKNFINGCLYPDATDLLCITDILISDYSSIIYEFSVLEKPIVFYAYDLEKYKKSRGFYINFPKDLPGDVMYNDEELYEYLINIKKNEKECLKKIQTFNKKYNYLNTGNVCKKFMELFESGYFK